MSDRLTMNPNDGNRAKDDAMTYRDVGAQVSTFY